MSATIMGEKRQTTLPADVVEAAGIQVNDQVDWRFEDGEIRGRKLVPANWEAEELDLVKRGGRLYLSKKLGREEIWPGSGLTASHGESVLGFIGAGGGG